MWRLLKHRHRAGAIFAASAATTATCAIFTPGYTASSNYSGSNADEDENSAQHYGPHGERMGERRYRIIAGPGAELDAAARNLVAADPVRFRYYPSQYKKFADMSDNIKIGGFPGGEWRENKIRGGNILYIASFHNNDATLTQFYALTMLCESFPASMTVLLPFYPTATMERVTEEGTVATANTLAKMLSNLPNVGAPLRVMVYDLHTLQNRFFFGNCTIATLHTAFPLLIQKMQSNNCTIDCVAFPDEGAEKRFGCAIYSLSWVSVAARMTWAHLFRHLFKQAFPDMELVTCGKKRDVHNPSARSVVVKDGDARGRNVVVVDDMIQTGGTKWLMQRTVQYAWCARDIYWFNMCCRRYAV